MSAMNKERGVALFISLVLLLVLTIIGVSAVQTTSLEQRMARNTHDSVLAFEAAEVALRSGETFLRNNVNSTALFPVGGNNGLWKASDYGQPEHWQQANIWTGNNSVQLANNTVNGVSEQPRYIIEWVATVQRTDNPYLQGSSYAALFDRIEIFRVTARGIGGTSNARVMLQSTFGMIF
ncbi:MAG TPA: PilX N-terminal domain-containing pilus assembly protein [Pseudomonadales bacterium]|nr:PilX N-terminal domain-containing pilus assembly protein [Pseudomonadales bacterium]